VNEGIQYLTVQDHLWINFQVTKKQNQFNFDKLEEGVFYQYGYGNSNDVINQAGRYAVGFVQKHPFADGNSATAFIGLLTFLKMNGYDCELPIEEAANWFTTIGSSSDLASEKIRAIIVKTEHHNHTPEVAEIAKSVMETFAVAITGLQVTPAI